MPIPTYPTYTRLLRARRQHKPPEDATPIHNEARDGYPSMQRERPDVRQRTDPEPMPGKHPYRKPTESLTPCAEVSPVAPVRSKWKLTEKQTWPHSK